MSTKKLGNKKPTKKVTISNTDKKTMVDLHKKGYTCTNIGKAFSISTQAVAAYVAWAKIRREQSLASR